MQVRVPHILQRAKHQGIQSWAFNPFLPFNLVSLSDLRCASLPRPFLSQAVSGQPPFLHELARDFGDLPLLGGSVWI